MIITFTWPFSRSKVLTSGEDFTCQTSTACQQKNIGRLPQAEGIDLPSFEAKVQAG